MRELAATAAIDPPRRVAIFRALQLGDMLCAVPALRSLRAGWPQAEITLIGLPWASAFARRFHHYIDRFIEFPGHRDLPEQPVRAHCWCPYVEAVRARRFDLALQMHGSGATTNRLFAELGASRNGGFFPSDSIAPDPATFIAWEEREHEVRRYVRLTRHLGLPDRGLHLEWPRLSGDEAASDLLPLHQLRGPLVVVHPGARLPSRRWPVARFAAVAERLAAQGCTIAITGSAEERELAARMQAAMRAPALDLAGKTGLGGVAAVIESAALVLCNDTGISHVAAAVGTPSVVICCGADPGRWAPLDTSRHVVLYQRIECRPCAHAVCPIGHGCATAVEAQAVFERCTEQLARYVRGESLVEVQ